MKRRRAREHALQILFQLDVRKDKPSAAILKNFWMGYVASDEVKNFAEEIVKGTYKHLVGIDKLIRRCAKNWSLDRMAVVDRNVLRMAVYEILYRMEIPTSVTINEAIEIARKYGTDESGAFVNGILDRVGRESGKLEEGKIED
ncbi:MAG TPA: transcription antitermination factor NusB [Nitrospirota bacterium]|nr:transcription antitermination factor NusB [Nitrospirota bacterium]